MVSPKGMRFPLDVILVCIRWYVAYPLSYRHLEEMMQERGVVVDHSTINRWAIRFLPLLEKVRFPRFFVFQQVDIMQPASPDFARAPIGQDVGRVTDSRASNAAVSPFY